MQSSAHKIFAPPIKHSTTGLYDYSQAPENQLVINLEIRKYTMLIAVAFLANGDVALLNWKDSFIYIVNPHTGICESKIYLCAGLSMINVLPNGDLVCLNHSCSSTDPNKVTIIDVKTNEPKLSWDSGEGDCLIILPGSEIVTIANESIMIWDSTNGQLLRTLKGHTKDVVSIDILSSGDIVSISYDETMRIWSKTDTLCKKVIHIPYATSVVRTTSSGELITFTYGNLIRIWDKDTGICKNKIETKPLARAEIVILPTNHIAIAENNEILIFDTRTGTCVQRLKHQTEVILLALSPITGDLLSFDKANMLYIWKFPSLRMNFDDHQSMRP